MYSASEGLGGALGRQPKDTLICFSHLRWNFVYQRPQHLLRRAAKRFNVVVVEEPVFEAGAERRLDTYVTREGVTVAVPVLPEGLNGPEINRAQRKLVDQLLARSSHRKLVAWYYTPMALPFSRHLHFDLCIYDNMDELSSFRGAPPRLVALERELFRRADLVFTGGLSLYEAKKSRHSNVHAFPSSIDASHFVKARQPAIDPPDYAGIPHPRFGFFGVIDERMDLALVAAAADLKPDWHFVMIGPVVKIDPSSLPQRANLHWIGGRSYDDLPAHLAAWDVGVMPFARNESTRYISPTKTPEFLAAGVPVVSTAITDVVRPYGDLGLVEIAADPADFVAKAEMLLGRDNKSWLRKVDAHLATTSWDLTWSEMERLVQRGIEPKPGDRLPAPALVSANV